MLESMARWLLVFGLLLPACNDEPISLVSPGSDAGLDVADATSDVEDPESGFDATPDTLPDSCSSLTEAWGHGGDRMFPGSDCLACHATGGAATSLFSAAGTVFENRDCPVGVQGAVIELEDAAGVRIQLVTNEVGNFYSEEALVPPFTVSMQVGGRVFSMLSKAPVGSCNTSGCHSEAGGRGLLTPQGK